MKCNHSCRAEYRSKLIVWGPHTINFLTQMKCTAIEALFTNSSSPAAFLVLCGKSDHNFDIKTPKIRVSGAAIKNEPYPNNLIQDKVKVYMDLTR